jgi:DNA segregation ATPase FtsK/SpoIIIE-like protein
VSSRILAADKALALVELLKSTIEDFAARADKLTEEHRTKVARERQRSTMETSTLRQSLIAAAAEQDENFQKAKAAAQARYEQRKIRIGDAYQASKEQALNKVDKMVGGRRYEMQKKVLQAEKDRDAGLQKATTTFEEFKKNLDATQEELAQFERDAQRAFKGYGSILRTFFKAYEKVEVDQTADEVRFLVELKELLARVKGEFARFRGYFLFRVFRYLPVWIVLVLCVLALPFVLQQLGRADLNYQQAIGIAVGAGVFVLVLRFLGLAQAKSLASSISQSLARSRRLHDLAKEKSEARYHSDIERAKKGFQNTLQTEEQQVKQAVASAGDLRVKCRMESDQRTVRATAKSEQLYRVTLQRLDQGYAAAIRERTATEESKLKIHSDVLEQKVRAFASEYDASWTALEAEWKSKVTPIFENLAGARSAANELFPRWDSPSWKSWKAPRQFGKAARFAELKVDLEKFCQAMPKDKRLALPEGSNLSLPLCLTYPEAGSILLETGQTGHDEAVGALNNIILRLLSVSAPGRLNFTVIDPVGLGQNFAGVMHLADYEEQIINNRIWTQSGQIEQKLADLNEHMEKVIQMYLRNEYQTIAEYNEQAGVIAEKYYFLVVADFPVNFTETAAKRLLSIAASGARCGVYTLLHWDTRQPVPAEFLPDELRKAAFCITAKGKEFMVSGKPRPGLDLALDAPASPEVATEFIQSVGKQSRDSSRVEVPFEQVAPADGEMWSEDTSSELRVAIGRTGATKLQYLAIGKGTRQHGLIAGKTGSGKSTLFHVVITNLALWCDPEQVEFYLVDFKKGVEFKCYATKHLPHARVVAIESDREFGLSVLQRVDDELRKRGDLFRQLGVQDVAGYKRAGGKEPIPRTLLLIDEFQEFFVEDDKIAQTASLLLDRIVRQGRAFGIHVLLGSQTLGGAYTVARTTLGQMVIRIALQCNEADAYLIMDDNNPTPRLLSRPGEGIYNDMAGALEGNSPFQVVWLPEEVRDRALTKVRERANQNPAFSAGPIVFEGNAPADVTENTALGALLKSKVSARPAAGHMWLGAPNSIKGPTEAVFHRQSGNHLLIVGQRDEAILAIFSVGLISLAAQFPPGAARFIICDATPPGTPQRDYLEAIVSAIPHEKALLKPGDIPQIMQEIAPELKKRGEDPNPESAPAVFLFIHGLQRFSKLRFEEEFGFSSSDSGEVKPGAVFNDLISDGARLGFHVIATCDTYNNVNRFLSRKALSEFEMRVLFQMSANDSASLIDSPKAGMLGLHRAVLFNAQEGYLETFRPYALPSPEWVEQAARGLT